MTGGDFDAFFDKFRLTARKLETGRRYVAPGEAERIQAFEEGRPRPVRSVRTEPWLARIAVTTATDGKRWMRIRVLDEPLTAYQAYGMPGLVESQAAGEEVRIVRRADAPDLSQDFWLFDSERIGELEAYALLMSYDAEGCWLGAHPAREPNLLKLLLSRWDRALAVSVPLNEYLAGHRDLRAA